MDEWTATRTTLLERLKDWQDDLSWQEFFDIYWKLIYGVAVKGGLSEVEAQDIVQETMISVARHISAFKYDRTTGTFKTWLLNATRWRISDHIRRQKSRHDEQQHEADTQWMDELPDPASLDLEKWWDDQWEKNLLDTAITKVKRQMEPEKYQIYDFFVNKEWPAEKIASTFKTSVNNVYVAKHRVEELIKHEAERLKKEIV